MNVFGIGLPELAVIAAIALLVFGPKRLPEMGRSLGRTLKGFQSASQEFEREFRQGLAQPDASASQTAMPASNPAAALSSADDTLAEPGAATTGVPAANAPTSSPDPS